MVKWLFSNGSNAIWCLDEYGAIVSAAGPFGPYKDAKLGIVTIDSPTPNQLWHWIVTEPQGHYGLNTWSVSSNGQVIPMSSFGPVLVALFSAAAGPLRMEVFCHGRPM